MAGLVQRLLEQQDGSAKVAEISVLNCAICRLGECFKNAELINAQRSVL
jgi:hypothetical protein